MRFINETERVDLGQRNGMRITGEVRVRGFDLRTGAARAAMLDRVPHAVEVESNGRIRRTRLPSDPPRFDVAAAVAAPLLALAISRIMRRRRR